MHLKNKKKKKKKKEKEKYHIGGTILQINWGNSWKFNFSPRLKLLDSIKLFGKNVKKIVFSMIEVSDFIYLFIFFIKYDFVKYYL